MRRRPQVGTAGVAGIFVWVILWDLLAPQEITAVVRDWLQHPVKRWPTGAMIGLTAAHLLGCCPPHVDPWHLVGQVKRKPFKFDSRLSIRLRDETREPRAPSGSST